MPKSKVSREEVASYWMNREEESGLAIDWADAHERCWRCGYKASLQFCHIVPEALGGPREASNLVLLCGRCHREAPNVQDPRFMWVWLRSTCVPFYDTYWTARGIQEFERMFGRKPFAGSEFDGVAEERALKMLQEELALTVVHFGEGRLNPSTYAAIFARIEEQITGKPVAAVQGSSDNRYYLEAIGMTRKLPR
jgi:hypothetical protein